MKTLLSRRPERFIEATIDGDVVLMDVDSGRFFTLRLTAAAVWALIDGTRDRDAIAASLHRDFAGPVAVIDRELDGFVAELREVRFVA